MGEAAIVSHMQGKKHCSILKASSAPSVTTFLDQPNERPRPTTTSNEPANAPNDERKETKEFLVTAVTKLLEKFPLKYTLVRNLAWLDPQKIKENPERCEKQLRLCLQIISSAGQIRENKCDTILNQFRDFAVI
ncbi:hypothetical protein AAFF_G00419230 [Aldrovandia affinis]|uniref:Uncharacterized protein n=1 Tax=Aldrovandia affinis TaxID=143900 RepID=A0AAD7WIY4_9TELE|nr:hypothetical protein AAFF_G00419230 [Aldrovandia affinis]